MPHLSRFFVLVIFPALLVASAWAVWQSAYEHLPRYPAMAQSPGPWPDGFQVVAGGDRVHWESGPGRMRLSAAPGGPVPTVEIPIGHWPRGTAVHLVFEVESEGLARGDHPWQEGRVALIWRDAAGEMLPGHQGIAGGDGVTRQSGEKIAPLDRPGRPSLIVQNLGRSGDFLIRALALQPVRLRSWARPAAVGLVAVTLLWLTVVFRGMVGASVPAWRCVAAAGFFTAAIWGLVLPGPWRPFLPILKPFSIGGEISRMEPPDRGAAGNSPDDASTPMVPSIRTVESPPPVPGSPVVQPAQPARAAQGVPGQMENGIWLETYLWVKKQARPVLHFSVFVVLSGISIILLGRRGWIPMGVLAMATEAMQALFGFAFVAEDMGDLLVDGLGIAAGAYLAGRVIRWFSRRSVATAT